MFDRNSLSTVKVGVFSKSCHTRHSLIVSDIHFASIRRWRPYSQRKKNLALEEQKREDLLREAVAYRRRLKLAFQLQTPEVPQTAQAVALSAGACDLTELFAGIRSDGSWSIYFGEEPVIQFTPAGELRRLFIDNRKYRVVAGKLVELTRSKRGGRIELIHQHISAEAERALRDRCLKLLQHALQMLKAGHFTQMGQVPADDLTLLQDLHAFLEQRDSLGI